MIDSYTPHKFNPSTATVYSIPAALIFGYISFRSRQTTGRWVAITLEALCKQYPYLGEWQVRLALKQLVSAGKKTPALIFRKQVRGDYFYMPAVEDDPGAQLHTFDVRVAIEVGVLPAIIYHNVSYWIKKNWMEHAAEAIKFLKPESYDFDEQRMQRIAYRYTRKSAGYSATLEDWLGRHTYATKRSTERGFQCLQEKGLLFKTHQNRRKPVWHLPAKTLRDFECDMLARSSLENSSAKTTSLPPKPHFKRQNHTFTAKTTEEQGLTATPSATSEAVLEAHYEAPLMKPVTERQRLVTDSTLPRCRSEERSSDEVVGSASPTLSAKILAQLRKLDKPHVPKHRKKVYRNSLGKITRPYIRKPDISPDAYDYEEEMALYEAAKARARSTTRVSS